MNTKRRIHDALVGGIIAVGVALAAWVSPVWLWLPGLTGLAMLQSGFSGYCPVYHLLEKLAVPEHVAATPRDT